MKPRFTRLSLRRAKYDDFSTARPVCMAHCAGNVILLFAVVFALPAYAGQAYTWSADSGGWWVDPDSGPTNWLPSGGNPVGVDDIAIFPSRGHSYNPWLNMNPSIAAVYVNSSAETLLSVAGRSLTLSDGLYVNGVFSVGGGSGGTVRANTHVSVGVSGEFYVQDGATLAMHGATMHLDGPLTLRYGGTYGNGALECGADFTVDGPGALAMDGASVTGAATLTNAVGHLIRGPGGTISAPLDNLGTVEADTGWLRLDTGAKSNSGLLRASNGGRIEIGNTIVTQSVDGEIAADGGTVNLLNNATVIGGTLSTSGGGVIDSNGAIVTTLQDVTNLGTMSIWDGAHARFAGTTLVNDGTIGVHYGGTYGCAQAEVLGPLTLTGSGDLYLTCGTLWGVGPLTDSAGHLIHGGGGSSIQVPVVNDGEIRADLPDLRLRAPITNNNLVGAVAGGWMDIHGPTTITQMPDAAVFADGGNVLLTGSAGIVGGKLNSAGSARIQTTGAVNDTLTDVTNMGEVYVGDGATLSLMGSSFVNQGTLGIHYGGTYGGGTVAIMNAIVISGPGDILFTNGNMWTNNTTVTHAADHTIHGGGGTFSGVMINQGLVDADTLNATLALRAEIANSGTLRARNGGKLDVHTCSITQSGAGKMVADGGDVNLGSATITGGLFESSGASAFTAGGGGTNTTLLSTLTNNAAISISDGASLWLTNTTIHGNGTIGIYYGGTSGDAKLILNGSVTLDGTGRMEFGGANISGSSLSNGPSHTIHSASATFEPQMFVNQGLFAADTNNALTRFRPSQVTNSGVIKAANGGRLEIGPCALTQVGGGELSAEGANVQLTNGANIVGGRLTRGGAFRFEAGAPMTASFTSLINDAEVFFHDAATLSLNGVITNNGPINIAYGGMYGGSHCTINSNVTLNGAGDLYISEGDLNCNGASVLTNGPGHMLHGKGNWSGTFDNYGMLKSDLATITLSFTGPPCGNHGWMIAQGGHHFVLNNASAFENAAVVRLDAGSWMTVGGGSYRQTAGQTTVNGGIQLSGAPFDLSGGALIGGGTIIGHLSNTGGTVAPGDPVAALNISGNYTQGAAGRLHVEIAGTTPGSGYDVLAVSGVATLDGTLHITRAHCFAVPIGQPFTVLTAGSRVGEFAHIVTPTGVAANVSYTATSVVVQLTSVCEAGDLNCDGTVNTFDIQPFVELLMPPHANPCSPCAGDTNQDGSVNQFDINAFVECLIM